MKINKSKNLFEKYGFRIKEENHKIVHKKNKIYIR